MPTRAEVAAEGRRAALEAKRAAIAAYRASHAELNPAAADATVWALLTIQAIGKRD